MDAGDEGICLGCGAIVAEITASGECPACGRPLMKRQARLKLGLANVGPEHEGGTPPMPPEVEEAARRPQNPFAGKYILFRKIGSGGMGSVWKAWEKPLARFVAIKFLNVPSGEDVLRFEREAKLAASLSHPNIAPVYEFGRSQGEYYMVMKFIDGIPLTEAKLDGAQLLKVMMAVCQAVHHAHEAGVIHRDLKPHNIMMTADGWPYVMDFSLAKQVEGGRDLSISGAIMGTPPYMAPEQAKGQRDRIDRRTDVYGLGATLYQLATGRAPFEGASPMDVLVKVMEDEVVPPRAVRAQVSGALEAITLKALEKDPGLRYATAAELGEDLRRLSAGETILAKPPLRRFVPRLIRRNPAISATLALAVLAVAAAFLMAGPSEAARREWWEKFQAAQAPLQAETMAALMKRIPEGTEREVLQWYRNQANERQQLLDGWGRELWWDKRGEARRLGEWARAMASVLRGLTGDFASARAIFENLAARAEAIAAFRGQVTLRIHVFPHALVRSMKIGNRWFIQDGRRVTDQALGAPSDENFTSPLVLSKLEIDDYVIELFHPEHGTHTASVRKDHLEHDGTYWLRGSLREGGSFELRPGP